MNVTDFNFELPPELIAQDPLEDRAASRLLVLDKKTGEMEHRHFRDILQYLKRVTASLSTIQKLSRHVSWDIRSEQMPESKFFF